MIKYDKLRNITEFENKFDFLCPFCKTDGIKENCFELKPIGISWKPDPTNDNSDIKNVVLRKGYNSLPTLDKALLMAHSKLNEKKGISIFCKKCKVHFNEDGRMALSDLRRWISKNVETFLDLRQEV